MQLFHGLLHKTIHQLCVTTNSIIFAAIVQHRWTNKVVHEDQVFLSVQNGRLIDSCFLVEQMQAAGVSAIDLLFDQQLVLVPDSVQLALYWCMLENDAVIDGRILLQYILLIDSLDIEIRSITLTNAK